SWLADPADLDCVVVGEAVRRLLVGRVGDARPQILPVPPELAVPGLGLLELGLEHAQLLQLLGRRLAFELRAGAELADSALELAPAGVDLQQLVEQLGRSLAGERRPESFRILARRLQVDHALESRYASRTCATPSSSTDGQMKSARAFTRSCAFSTATP